MLENNLVSQNTMQDEDCLFCASKHLSQAYITAVEALQGYTMHRWLAVGHLAEAERETINEFKSFSDKIRDLRARMMGQNDEGWTLQDITALLMEARHLAANHNGYSENEHLFKYYSGKDELNFQFGNPKQFLNQIFGNPVLTAKDEDDQNEDSPCWG